MMNFAGGGILVLVSPYSWLQEYCELQYKMPTYLGIFDR